MLKKHIFIFILLGTYTFGMCQSKTSTKTPTITTTKKSNDPEFSPVSFRLGTNLSVVHLTRNIKENNNELGYSGGAIYSLNNFVRVSALYTQYKKIDIEPTWYNIKAKSIEANLEILAKFPNNKTFFYPFVGLSYNTYNGFFTGEEDYLNLKETYKINSIIKSQYVGFNIGTGLEHNFGILGLFADYRMRVGRQEKAINIMDVCFTGGLKINIPKHVFKNLSHLNDRYYWF